LPVLLPLISVLSAAPLVRDASFRPFPFPRNPEASASLDAGEAHLGSTESSGVFVRSLGCGLAGSLGGGLLGYWSMRAVHASEPGMGGLVGTASGMVLGSALGAWSKREPGARYGNPMPPVLGATVGGAVGVGVWGLAGLVSSKDSESMSWEAIVLLIGAPWVGAAVGAEVEQDWWKEPAVAVTPWVPAAGGAGVQVCWRY